MSITFKVNAAGVHFKPRCLSEFFWQSLLEPSSKLLSFVIQYGVFSLSYLVELCGLCYKTFSKVNVQSIGLQYMGFL